MKSPPKGPTPPRILRLHLIVRKDLPPGSQLAQIVHGQDEFRDAFPDHHRAWREESNTVVVHHAENLPHLEEALAEAELVGVPHAVFREENLGLQPTCMVLNPYAPGAVRLARRFPLAG